jgi:AGZA family xanthine/uracil permease-like MFS transporter
VGLVSLTIILATLVARIELPARIPGGLVALVAGGAIYYFMLWTGTLSHEPAPVSVVPRLAFMLPSPNLEWVAALRDSLQYLPVVIPFALATVIGGIDCTESAVAAGDEYSTGWVVGIEAIATLAAGLAGGVVQTTPYIGHPAYKAMGGRAAYTLATGLFIGGAGIFGYFAHIYVWVPPAAIFPILVFVGLEITAQSFHATPARHYPAVALACLPAMAYLVTIFTTPLLGHLQSGGQTVREALGPLAVQLDTLRLLANGFIITSLLWASSLAAIIDRRLSRGGLYFGIAAVASLFGVIHSPDPGGSLVLPWPLGIWPEAELRSPYYFAVAYAASALLLLAWGAWLPENALPAEQSEAEH